MSTTSSPATVRNVDRDLGWEVQRGMAAGEDQPQPVVLAGRGVVAERGHRQLAALVGGPAEEVDRPVPGGQGQPGRRVGRRPVRLPADERLRERITGGVLGQRPVARHPDEPGDDACPVRTVRLGDGVRRRAHSSSPRTGRISMRPWRAIGCRLT